MNNVLWQINNRPSVELLAVDNERLYHYRTEHRIPHNSVRAIRNFGHFSKKKHMNNAK